MFKHYFVFIYRNLKRHKSTFFINVVGLSCGLACVLMIYLWVNDELSFDKYHSNDSRLYQVMSNSKSEKGIETGKETPHTLSEVLAREIPEVEFVVTATPNSFLPAFTLSGNNKKVKGVGKFASKNFFKIFSYNIIQGDRANILSNKNAVVLSQSQAQSLFRSTDNVVGKTISYDVAGIKRECIVTGVFKDVPVNSSEHFDFVLSFDDLKDIMQIGPTWDLEPFCTYLTVKKGTDINRFDEKLTQYIRNKSKDTSRSFFLKRFSDNYLYSKYLNGKDAGGRIDNVKLFSLIALFILIISSINFINLSTAKAATRAKEIGIKKAIGVSRKVLILQYLGEALLINFISAIVAVMLVAFLLPQFNAITRKDIHLQLNPEICLVIIGTAIITGFLSGSYPAFYLSGFKTTAILKGRFTNTRSEEFIRKGLVIFQFSLTIIFIISILVLNKQINYIQNKNLGFDKNNVVYFESDNQVSQAFLNEIQKLSTVEIASTMQGNLIGDEFGGKGNIDWNGKKIPVRSFGVNYGLLETLGIKIKEGRSFLKSFGASNNQIIVNEAAAQAMNLKNPVGTLIKMPGNNMEIIGVVKNFHIQSLHEKIEPMKFRIEKAGASTIVVKIKKGEEKAALVNLEVLYKKFNPGLAFHYKFLDQDYQALYASEKQISLLSQNFTGLSILISCLGLFGLAAFTTEMRIKEIGIRKVLGASANSVVVLLSKDFLKLVLFAIVIAFPLSWLAMNRWLNSFAYRTSIGINVFLIAGISIILITICTVSFLAVKAALANPVKNLRSE